MPKSATTSLRSCDSSESSGSLYIAETALPLSESQDVANYKSTQIAAESEFSPLLPTVSATQTPTPNPIIYTIIPLLLIGVFLSNADGSIVMATYGLISSTFNSFANASWLTTSFSLAVCAVQPILGKISDIYGRKSVLLFSYATFATGSVLIGISQTMSQVIFGRVVAGVGAAGMSVIVAVLITDLVPLIQVASYRSYVNVISTFGRSIGGPLGGFLADTIGWRWSFIGQAPLILVAIILVGWKLPSSSPSLLPPKEPGQPSKLHRIDFVGAFLLAIAIVGLLGTLSLGGQSLPWSHPLVIGMLLGSLVIGTLFVLYEIKVPLEPIFPPSLIIQRDVATPCAITALQTGAQVAMMFSVPLYFRVTQNSSNTTAGSHLFPAVLGNTVGALLSGIYINKTGSYKFLFFLSSFSSLTAYLLMYLFWEGNTSWPQSLQIVPGGFGAGIAQSATFIALQGSVRKEEMAMATGAMFLCGSIGMMVGVAGASSVQMGSLRWILEKSLPSEVIEKVIEDVGNVYDLDGEVRRAVIAAYVRSLGFAHLLSFGAALIALLVAFTVREHKLR